VNQHPAPRTTPGDVVVVGAGPVGSAAALLLADAGVPVTLLERHAAPHPLPRAVHVDDEVARILHAVGVGEDFLARSKPASGLRLVDARHRVMAEFGRQQQVGRYGYPQANMFHQPDLEQLLLARVAGHPLIDLRRGLKVVELDHTGNGTAPPPVRVVAERCDGAGGTEAFPARYVLGCDGANSTVRGLVDIEMADLHFTERWLVVDVRAGRGLRTYEGVEQVCDPARAATFMHVTRDWYRWEFQLRDGEDEADLIAPEALGRLLRPWTGQNDLAGLEVVRSAVYTFRARVAPSFRSGRVFLLGDAAHLTPPFIGQGLGAGLRDADNLSWKIAQVLTGRADASLLDSYDAERRPHARTMVRKAVAIGWAMTGGQDAAAFVRRVALAAACRSATFREALASPSTPRLRNGALQQSRRPALREEPRVGALIGNPPVEIGGVSARLDDVLRRRTAVLTARLPEPELVDLCRRHDLQLIRILPGGAVGEGADAAPDGCVTVTVNDANGSGLAALVADPGIAVVVRPDRVVASIGRAPHLPPLPWSIRPVPIPATSSTPV
jgi:3-(3-hydroxy-phenyl)propionate hydroxylase